MVRIFPPLKSEGEVIVVLVKSSMMNKEWMTEQITANKE